MDINQAKIRQFVSERNIGSVLHFCPVQNLPSILEHGLLPRARLEKEGIKYVSTDGLRIDGRLDASCTSISFPNYKMFYAKRMGMDEVNAWVVLVIEPSVLWELQCLFLPDNAASHRAILRHNPRCFFGPEALAELFDESMWQRHRNLPERFTTNPQAEVLIFDGIPPSKIRKVLVQSEGVRQGLHNWIPAHLRKPNMVVAENAFSYRLDFEDWR